jgi:hypothetical protein
MYSLSQLFTGLRNPRRAAEEINELVANHLLRHFRPGIDVFDEDWDNLLILDGCRWDLLRNADLPGGQTEHRWSAGSSSQEFLAANLDNRTLPDTVWVSANPWVSYHEARLFHVESVWKSGWNEHFETVLPETVEQAALEVLERYPKKRLVVHFMQPHYPFIGPTGRTLPDHRTFTGDGRISDLEDAGLDIWTRLRRGEVDPSRVWDAYRENLDIVLPSTRRLVGALPGKTVVTADHGNAFGERAFPIPTRLYGHPGGYRTSELVKVPWVVFESNQRRTIVDGEPDESTGPIEAVETRLEQLGYR